jgi:filamentous hemagglutinin family protein
MRGLSGFFRFAFFLGAVIFAPGGAYAGITVDGTLGREASLSGPDYQITAELGRMSGNNLFHSFGLFSLSQGESAIFSGPSSIVNIIGRVTGGSASNIDGTLGATISAANLYLINPAGLIFGPHATLDIGGSFYASSASYVKLSDGSRFDALATSPGVLSTASPVAFGFLGNNSGAIAVNGSRLQVGNGQQLVLAGRGVRIEGRENGFLSAPSGWLGLYSAEGNGEIGLNGSIQGQSPYPSLGRIEITDGARVTAGGSGGRMVIRGGRLLVENALLLSQNNGGTGGLDIEAREVELDGALLQSATDGTAHAGTISIKADRLNAVNGSIIDTSTFAQGDGGVIKLALGELGLHSGSRIVNSAFTDASGHGGATSILVADTLRVEGRDASGNASGIFNYTSGSGNAGELRIDAGSVRISDASIQSASYGSGQAGAVRIRSGDIILDGDGMIHVSGQSMGDAGIIEIDADRIELRQGGWISAESVGGGRAGTISVSTGTLDMSDGGKISARAYYSATQGGDISVSARDYVHITGRSESRSSSPGSDEVSTGILSFNGNISVVAPEIVLADSAGISTRTWNDLRSGDLTVKTSRLVLLNGGHLSAEAIGSSAYYGGAGNVTVHAGESILVSGMAGSRRSGIQSGTRSSGDAGTVTIDTPFLRISDDGMVSTSTGVFGEGGAGEIVINAGAVEVFSSGRILSSSSGYGGGGNITVNANQVLLDQGAISAFGTSDGVAGRISIHAPLVTMKDGLINTESGGRSKAGDILLEADALTLSSGSRIKSDSSGSGDAGHIMLVIRGLFQVDDSTVTTGAERAGGGNIDIQAGSVTLRNESAITASVGGGSSDGGNVSITTDGFAAVGNSDITARADLGHGGRIAVGSKVFLRTPDVDLDASSNVSGNEGVVEVNAPKLDISGNLVVLTSNYLDLSGLLDNPCLGRYVDASSFLVRSRGGLPSEPDGLLPGPLLFEPYSPVNKSLLHLNQLRLLGDKVGCNQSPLTRKEVRL